MMLSAAGIAIDFECAPDECFVLQAEEGLLVHANHWTNPVAPSKLHWTELESVPASLYRDLRVRAALAPKRGGITVEDVKAALSDDWGTPHAVCRPPRPGESGNLSATVATIVIRPGAGSMEIAPLPALGARFTTYRLDAGERVAA
jgi:isopenicillin-N N-acyltransferase-like protein